MSVDDLLRSHSPTETPVDVDAALDAVQSRHRRGRRGSRALMAAGVVALVAGVGAVVATISDDDGDAVTTDDGQASSSVEDLVGVEWRFERFEFADGRDALDIADSLTSLTFREDGSFSFEVCGHGDGIWSDGGVDDDRISMQINRAVSFECGRTADAAQNNLLDLVDEDTVRWDLTDDTLRLSDETITAVLARPAPVFPSDIEPLLVQSHPASSQMIIGYTTGDTTTIEMMARATPDDEFATASVPSAEVMAPIGLAVPGDSLLLAAWVPSDAAKVWVELSSGGAEINLDLAPVDAAGVAGWTRLPPYGTSGDVVAFDAAGNEIARASFSISS